MAIISTTGTCTELALSCGNLCAYYVYDLGGIDAGLYLELTGVASQT